jgi:hypothetical protein
MSIGLWWWNLKEGDHLEDLGADSKVGRMILKPVLNGRAWTAFVRLRTVIRAVSTR